MHYQKGNFLPVIGVFILLIIASGIYFAGVQKGKSATILQPNNAFFDVVNKKTVNISPSPSSTATTPDSTQENKLEKQTNNGASLNEVKYTLPSEWTATLHNDPTHDQYLELVPNKGGGYLTLMVYDYPGTSGRREYYCQIRHVCIDSTYFTGKKLGNIDGYRADSLDNSGGGPDYFGAKGNKFYIIGTYTPPASPEVGKAYQQIFDSLIF